MNLFLLRRANDARAAANNRQNTKDAFMFNASADMVSRPKAARPFLGVTLEEARASRQPDFVVKNECCDYDYAPGVVKAADGIIEILDYIGGWGVYACEVIPVLRAMDGEGKTIVIRINSYGGDVFEGLAIANTIADLKAHTIVEIIGMAASIASVIAEAADEVLIRKSAQFMIHSPWAVVIGDANEMRAVGAHLDQIEGQIVDVYADRSAGKKSRDEIAAAVARTEYFTGAQAVEWGFADRVLEKAKVETKVDAAALEEAGIKNAATETESEAQEAPVVPGETETTATQAPADAQSAVAVEELTPAASQSAEETSSASAPASTAPQAAAQKPTLDAASIGQIRAAFARTKNPAAADEAIAGGLTVEQSKALAFDILADEDTADAVNTTIVGNEGTTTPAAKTPEQVMAEIRARQFARANGKLPAAKS